MKKTTIALTLTMLILLVLAAAAPGAQGEEGTEYEKGLAAYQRGEYGLAVWHMKEYVRTTPEAKAYYLLAYSVYEIGRKEGSGFDEAAEYFEQAYLLDPDFDPRSIGLIGLH